MINTAFYFGNVQLAFTLLMVVYVCTLQRDSRLVIQRIFLLAFIPWAFLMPLVEVPTDWLGAEITGGQTMNYLLNAVQISGAVEGNSVNMWYTNPLLVGVAVYLAGVVLGIARITFALFSFFRIVHHQSFVTEGCYRIYNGLENESPYSFFHNLFIPPTQRHNVGILVHEKAHAQQLHSVDRLMADLLVAVLWVNPFVHWWRKSLVDLHEFQADRVVVRSGIDCLEYSRNLVEASYEAQGLELASSFKVNLTKKRLLMIQNINKKQHTSLFLLFGLLLTIGVFFACSEGEAVKPTEEIDVAEQTLRKPSAPIHISQSEFESRKKTENIFRIVEKMPEYIGGFDALGEFISKEVKYPEKTKSSKVGGRVFVQFIVNADGSVSNVDVVRGVSTELDEEALRVVQLLPDWKPGTQGGKAVPVYYTIPINFSLK